MQEEGSLVSAWRRCWCAWSNTQGSLPLFQHPDSWGSFPLPFRPQECMEGFLLSGGTHFLPKQMRHRGSIPNERSKNGNSYLDIFCMKKNSASTVWMTTRACECAVVAAITPFLVLPHISFNDLDHENITQAMRPEIRITLLGGKKWGKERLCVIWWDMYSPGCSCSSSISLILGSN